MTTDQSPLREFLKEYADLTNKYEALLSKTSEVNAQLNLKLNIFPTVESVNACITAKLNTLPTLDAITGSVTTYSAETKKINETAIKSLEKNVESMLYRFNWLLTAITLATLIGGYAVWYVNSIINVVEKPRHVIEHPIDNKALQPHVDYIDEDGKKIIVPFTAPPHAHGESKENK